jgi:hypothetical protein
MTRTVVKRFDLGELKNVETTTQGYVRAPVWATRTGVFVYRKPDGSVLRELRHPDDVFNIDSLATLKLAPITLEHPREGLLTPQNTKHHIIGVISEDVKKEDTFVATVATIMDAEAIAAIKAGKQEVSCGYECELEFGEGEFEGERYDARQRMIRYNHMAVVGKGRAGPNVKLKLDADNNQLSDDGNSAVGSENQSKGDTMEKVMLGGKEYEVSPELKAALEAHMGAMKTELDGFKSQMEAAKSGEGAAKAAEEKAVAKADALQTEVEKLKSTHNDGADFMAKFKARKALEVVAERTLSKEKLEKLDAMSDNDIRSEVIKAEQPTANLEGKSAEYISARFDAIADLLADDKGDSKNLGKGLSQARKDGIEGDSEAARKRSIEASKNAWKTLKQA